MANKYLDVIKRATYEPGTPTQNKTKFEVKFKVKNFAGKILCNLSREPGLSKTIYKYRVGGCTTGMPIINGEVTDKVNLDQNVSNLNNETVVKIFYTENGTEHEDQDSMDTTDIHHIDPDKQ